MPQALNRFIYHSAEIPKEHDPYNLTPEEKHAKMIKNDTGNKNTSKVVKAFTEGW